MHGYEAESYGDGMADVYDEWYGQISDVESTIDALRRITSGITDRPARILELGIGTGRLALPLAAAGVDVTGIDTSAAMLERLKAKRGADSVTALIGDMIGPLPAGPFDAVFVAYNTFFNLVSDDAQRRCMHAVSEVLDADGIFAVEVFVPSVPETATSIEVRSMAVDRVVLSIAAYRPERQSAEGHFVELTESGGVRLRPWAVRYATPEQLDSIAGSAGLHLEHRWEDWTGAEFTSSSTRHVSLYRRSRNDDD